MFMNHYRKFESESLKNEDTHFGEANKAHSSRKNSILMRAAQYQWQMENTLMLAHNIGLTH